MSDKVRLDKWLWAARFFKTRSLATAAIEAGHVHIDGQRVKVSREASVGLVLRVRQGHEEKTITVRALSDTRGPAPVAQALYQESEDSIAARQAAAEARRLSNLAHPDHRPSKRDRRLIHRFQDSLS